MKTKLNIIIRSEWFYSFYASSLNIFLFVALFYVA